MQLENVRKRTLIAAITGIIIGTGILLIVITLYVLYGATLQTLAEKESIPQATAVHLLKALKTLGLGVPGAMGLILIGLSLCTIELIRAEKREPARHD